MKFLKINMIIVWLFLIATQFIPVLSFIAKECLITLAILPVIHAAEFFFYLPILKKAPGNMAKHFMQVVIYGVIYYLEVKKLVAQTES